MFTVPEVMWQSQNIILEKTFKQNSESGTSKMIRRSAKNNTKRQCRKSGFKGCEYDWKLVCMINT